MSSPSNKKVDVTKEDVNNDGVLDTVTTTTIGTDVDGDGKVDITETSTVATDGNNGDVIKSSVNVVSNLVGVDGSTELSLVPSSENSLKLLQEIAELEKSVKCDRTQHIGSMTDYLELFKKAQEYMTTVGDKNINLLVDTSVLDKFALESEVYSKMFEEVTLKFQRLSSVDDTELLTKVRNNLLRIKLMYDNIQKFHATITATSILQIPESIKVVTESLQSVTESINCSLPYLEYFADNSTVLTEEQKKNAELNDKDKVAIQSALNALNLWINMVTNDANIAMSGNAYVATFKEKIAAFDKLNDRLSVVVDKVKRRLDAWKAGKFE